MFEPSKPSPARASGAVLELYRRGARDFGISPTELTRGLAFELADRPTWVAWDDVCQLSQRLREACGSLDALTEFGERIVVNARPETLADLLGLGLAPAALYRVVQGWSGPRLFPDFTASYAKLPDERIRLGLTIPAHARDSPEFFHLNLGCNRALPSLLGLPHAQVEMSLRERHATYLVTPPPSKTALHRLRRVAGVLVGREHTRVHAIFEQLGQQNRALQARAQEAAAARFSASRSEAELERVFAATGDPLLVTDDQLRVRKANAAAFRTLEWTESQLLGAHLEELFIEFETARFTSALLHCDEASELRNQNLELRSASGSIPVSVHASCIVGDGDSAAGLVVVIRDMREANHHARITAERNLMAVRTANLERALHELERANEEAGRMRHELDHRVKNELAVVIALTEQSLSRAQTLGDFRETFIGKLTAMARTHELLASTGWEHIDLEAMLERILATFEGVTLQGPGVSLPASAAPLGLAFYELATNAAKYGSLSAPGGTISIHWTLDDDVLELRWRESGGPKVTPPSEEGFGLGFVRRVVEYQFDGKFGVEFEPSGLVCDISISPVDESR